MTGFRLRDFWSLLVSVRDGTGSRYPLGAHLIATTAMNAVRDAAKRGEDMFFASLQPSLALAA